MIKKINKSNLSNITQIWVRILMPFSNNYSVKISASELARLSKVPQQSASRHLNNLVKLNLIDYDLSIPTNPTEVSSTSTGNTGTEVFVVGRYAYVATTANSRIFDVSDVSSPTQVSNTDLGAAENSVFVSGSYAYVTDNTDRVLHVVDVTNVSNPTSVSVGVGIAPLDAFVSGKYAYVVSNNDARMEVIDVSNPASPRLVANVSTTGGHWPNAVFVSGRYAYVATSNGGMKVFDLGGIEANTIVADSLEAGSLQVRSNARFDNLVSIRGGVNIGGDLLVEQYASFGNNSLVVSSNGNVGIGTTSPASKLEVVGTLTMAGDINPDGDNTRSLGTNSLRYANIYGVSIFSGDIILENDFRITEGDRVAEERDSLVFLNAQEEKIMKLDSKGNLWIKGEIKRFD